jgi:hypothetical protein
MFCFKVSEDEARQFWERMSSGHNIMKVFVPWCVYLHRCHHVEPRDYFIATMHYWDEYISLLTRMRIKGDYLEPK